VVGKRIFYVALGFVTTGLGILGIFLPGLPTTIFIIIALWAFSQSSPRLHRWLTKLPILRETMQQIEIFHKHKNLPVRTKLISQGAAWISCVAGALIIQSWPITIVLAAAAISCSVFMYIVPTRPATEIVESTIDS